MYRIQRGLSVCGRDPVGLAKEVPLLKSVTGTGLSLRENACEMGDLTAMSVKHDMDLRLPLDSRTTVERTVFVSLI